MAITLDMIEKKEFKVVKNGGYDQMEVEDFLNEILDEMDNREAYTKKLEEQVKAMTLELEKARTQAAVPAEAPVKAAEARRSESFELVLAKAQSVYDEIVSAADVRAAEIVAKATEEAASIRETAEGQISDLTEKLDTLRKQTANYYASVKKAVDEQAASMAQLKKLL